MRQSLTLVLILSCLHLRSNGEAEIEYYDETEDPEQRAQRLSVYASGSSSSGGYGQSSNAESEVQAVINSLENDYEWPLYQNYPAKPPTVPLKRPMPYAPPAEGYYVPSRKDVENAWLNYFRSQASTTSQSSNAAVSTSASTQSQSSTASTAAAQQGETCRYWCRNPANETYCCETKDQTSSSSVGTKPGFCPPVRPTCPAARSQARSRRPRPRLCSNDHSCLGTDKCCFDSCFQRHVCKPVKSS